MTNYAVEECVYCGSENQYRVKATDDEVRYFCSCGAETRISLQETDTIDG